MANRTKPTECLDCGTYIEPDRLRGDKCPDCDSKNIRTIDPDPQDCCPDECFGYQMSHNKLE